MHPPVHLTLHQHVKTKALVCMCFCNVLCTVVCTVTCFFLFSNWCLVCIGVVVAFLVGCNALSLGDGRVVGASCGSSCVSGAAVFLISCLLPAFYDSNSLHDLAPPPVCCASCPRHPLRAVGTSWLLPTSMLGGALHEKLTLLCISYTSCTSPTSVITVHFM